MNCVIRVLRLFPKWVAIVRCDKLGGESCDRARASLRDEGGCVVGREPLLQQAAHAL